LKPEYAEAYNNRSLALALSSKHELASAIADYNRAIQIRPDYAYAYNNRGVAYMVSGQPDAALRDFNRATQLQPDFLQAYSKRGSGDRRFLPCRNTWHHRRRLRPAIDYALAGERDSVSSCLSPQTR
jgi:tetratricopeptide (TPR) repeat protein